MSKIKIKQIKIFLGTTKYFDKIHKNTEAYKCFQYSKLLCV